MSASRVGADNQAAGGGALYDAAPEAVFPHIEVAGERLLDLAASHLWGQPQVAGRQVIGLAFKTAPVPSLCPPNLRFRR